MEIRKAKAEDLDTVMDIYGRARQFMRNHGNGDQWGDSYPYREMVEEDLGHMYLCVDRGQVGCVFYFAVEQDGDYDTIDGAWLDERPYGVVHRLASAGTVKGTAEFALNWAFARTGNIRIDTYKTNIPMQRLLEKCGFSLCGTIYRLDMDWMAYQKTEQAGQKICKA